MKLSVMLFPFHGLISNGSLAPATLVEEMTQAGITAIEPMLSNLDAAPEPWQEVLRLAKAAGMTWSCLDIGANLIGNSEEDRKAALETVKRGLALCAEWDCPVALIPGTRPSEGMSNEEGRKLYSAGLRQCADMAKEYGIIATIEDFGVYPAFACRSDHVLEVVTGAGPDVKVTYDNGNFLLSDETAMHALAATRDLTVHVHIKDFKVDPTGEAPLKGLSNKRWIGAEIGGGEGEVAEVVASLKLSGYDGWLSLEVNAPPVEMMRQGAQFVQQAWGQA
ncbi:MAG: sugar phosphate isomerase/epimerase family protein [Armatimonadia bacterium]